MNSKHLKDLDSAYYFIYLRDIKNAIDLYREENIPLFTELTNKAQKFGEISAQMMVCVDGKIFWVLCIAKINKFEDVLSLTVWKTTLIVVIW